MKDIDKHIGQRVRSARLRAGISQKILGGHIGVSHQQIVKYEEGSVSIPTRRLYAISMALNTPLSVLCTIDIGVDGMPTPESSDRELLELCKSFSEIQSKDVRRSISCLVRSIAGRE